MLVVGLPQFPPLLQRCFRSSRMRDLAAQPPVAAADPVDQTDKEGPRSMSEEKNIHAGHGDSFAAAKSEPSGYEPPKMIRVSLRPEEAVLGHCKVTGAMGPVASSSCRSFVSCRTLGS